jgi:hypothetical protein
MSFDLSMNDTCPKCYKALKPAVIAPHQTRPDLAIHSFECVNCSAVKTKILFRKQAKSLPARCRRRARGSYLGLASE